ncbi:ABC transporter ATP-binding protein [Brevundimonas sp.]|uniref:ABC transporter ATP-binding protein n=1 Tax=Brevundimonas sp. TaxID=1871086 RepID=UPI0025ECADAB|nr:ABC transporter ATP-binding protein [Brevundimonas sp.]
MAATGGLVCVDDVSRHFDGGLIVALDRLSLTIMPGELVGLHGPSGCGKSTLLNMMAGLDEPTGGAVSFEGARSPSQTAWARLRATAIGFVFQHFNLLPTLTARENVEVAMMGSGLGAAERRDRADRLLSEVGLGQRAQRWPAELSGGERQRVSVARSLANEPRLLLADEPTSNLDSRAGAEIMDLLVGLQAARGLAMVIVTHQDAVLNRCSRRVGMIDGRISGDVHV